MKETTRLNLAIAVCVVMIVLLLTLMATGCTEKQELKPWSVEQQCQYYRIWAKWPEHGECK